MSGPIKIVEMIAEEVGSPDPGGGPGSALYAVPFRLSRTPSARWAEFFVQAWNRPPSFTTMHRPGIAEVQGDRLVLTRTTVEEVEKYHLKTLRLALEVANTRAAQALTADDLQKEQKDREEKQHRRRVDEVSKRLDFD